MRNRYGIGYRLWCRAGTTVARSRSACLQHLRRMLYALYGGGLVRLAKLHEYTVPLPEVGILAGNRLSAGKGDTSWEKWRLVESTLPDGTEQALDVGCNNGFFALKLAAKGIFTIGVDPDEDLLRLAELAAFESKIGPVAFAPMKVDPVNVRLLPEVDVTLVLSVMHRWVREYGRPAALGMLRELMEKTRRCLYFEIPNPCQNAKERDVLSYMGSSEAECEGFIRDMLEGMAKYPARLLGYLPTDFRPDERRHLFVVERRPRE